MQIVEQNTLQLDNQKKLTMTGVVSVDTFSPNQLKLSLEGKSVVVCGDNLKVVNFNKSQGNLLVEGIVFEIKYLNKKPAIIKRIFK